MNSILTSLFNQPDRGYLSPQELGQLSRFVSSIPDRIKVYRQLRDNEVKLMQAAVDQVADRVSDLPVAVVEQSVKQALLMLRYSAMAVLLDDADFARQRLTGWLPTLVATYQTQPVDTHLHPALDQQLAGSLAAQQWALLEPALTAARGLLADSDHLSSPTAKPLAL